MNPPINALSDEAKILPDLLGQVIIEQEGKDVFDIVELLRQGFIQQRLEPSAEKKVTLLKAIENLDLDSLDRVIHAFTTFFHLANINEEYSNQKSRASIEKNGDTWDNSFLDTIQTFKNEGKK